ncbi:MAG TPA: tripartite tricarboxylate transporter substrate binding protein [Burkholderiales bacterium]|nr:tripartite tricarboxylate transporter substrate binding protein [Burkholderiales bacterium]
MRLERVLRAVLIGALAIVSSGAAAQATYPSRAVRIVVPFPPGGGTDIISRTVAQKLSETWGQPVIVDNRAGANGIIGTDLGSKAKPDGYTLLVVIATHAINPALYRKLPYDTASDFVPVTLMAQYPFILTIHPSLPPKTVKELIALAKTRPGQLSYASSGNGSGPHLGFELFKSTAKIDVVHIPYKGAGPANIDLISGQVQLMFNNFLAAMPQIRAGKLRVLAVTSAKRSPVMPDLATMAEAGLPGFDVTGWYALLAPAGTPAVIVNKVQADVANALRVPALNERLSSEGAEPVGSTPQQFGTFLAAEIRKWGKVISDAKVTPETL